MATAVVTGCSSGIGLHTAVALRESGYDTYATMRNLGKRGDLERTAAEAGVDLRVAALDVTDDTSVTHAVDHVLRESGSIDVVVNNAGQSVHGPAEEYSDDEARSLFEVNFFGAHRVMRAVLPTMREQASGVIVNVTSIAGLVTAPYFNMYAASKHALEALTESMFHEVRPFGIRVNLVEPGPVATAITANTVHIEGTGPDSPYWPTFSRISRLILEGIDANGIPARDAAEIVVEVCRNDDAPFRTIVGDNPRRLAQARRELDDDEFMTQLATLYGLA